MSSKWSKGTSGPAGDEIANLIAHTVRPNSKGATWRGDGADNLVTHSLRADGFDASEDGTGRGTPLVAVNARQDPIHAVDLCGPLDQDGSTHAIAFSSKDHGADAETDLAPTLRAGGHDKSHANAGVPPAIAFALRGREGGAMPEVHDAASALRSASGGSTRDYVASSAVRRLSPVECERLQGFPDGWTAIEYRGKPASDGPRYKALGNSFAVPVVRWIGRRIAMVDEIGALDASFLPTAPM
jgi:DNA (cytosine-5)-methyltransferase 1